MRSLARYAATHGATVDATDSIGIATQAREAIAMAALGAAAHDGVCITLDTVTGRHTRRVMDGNLARSHRIFTIKATSGGRDCG
jgi:1,6-anhydro-N-acetylmuramate kinase